MQAIVDFGFAVRSSHQSKVVVHTPWSALHPTLSFLFCTLEIESIFISPELNAIAHWLMMAFLYPKVAGSDPDITSFYNT